MLKTRQQRLTQARTRRAMARQQDAIAQPFNKASAGSSPIVIGQGRAGSMADCKARQLQEGTAGQGMTGQGRA